MSDIVILRANILGGMNEYIKELNPLNKIEEAGIEELLNAWYNVMHPDILRFVDEDELMEIAQDTELFNSLTATFSKIIAFYC